jgi:hypothetical protein
MRLQKNLLTLPTFLVQKSLLPNLGTIFGFLNFCVKFLGWYKGVVQFPRFQILGWYKRSFVWYNFRVSKFRGGTKKCLVQFSRFQIFVLSLVSQNNICPSVPRFTKITFLRFSKITFVRPYAYL